MENVIKFYKDTYGEEPPKKFEEMDSTFLLEFANAYQKQCLINGVGNSTFKVAISDRWCTYDYELELPKNTCINDIATRLQASFGLKNLEGKLSKNK